MLKGQHNLFRGVVEAINALEEEKKLRGFWREEQPNLRHVAKTWSVNSAKYERAKCFKDAEMRGDEVIKAMSVELFDELFAQRVTGRSTPGELLQVLEAPNRLSGGYSAIEKGKQLLIRSADHYDIANLKHPYHALAEQFRTKCLGVEQHQQKELKVQSHQVLSEIRPVHSDGDQRDVIRHVFSEADVLPVTHASFISQWYRCSNEHLSKKLETSKRVCLNREEVKMLHCIGGGRELKNDDAGTYVVQCFRREQQDPHFSCVQLQSDDFAVVEDNILICLQDLSFQAPAVELDVVFMKASALQFPYMCKADSKHKRLQKLKNVRGGFAECANMNSLLAAVAEDMGFRIGMDVQHGQGRGFVHGKAAANILEALVGELDHAARSYRCSTCQACARIVSAWCALKGIFWSSEQGTPGKLTCDEESYFQSQLDWLACFSYFDRWQGILHSYLTIKNCTLAYGMPHPSASSKPGRAFLKWLVGTWHINVGGAMTVVVVSGDPADDCVVAHCRKGSRCIVSVSGSHGECKQVILMGGLGFQRWRIHGPRCKRSTVVWTALQHDTHSADIQEEVWDKFL